MGFQRGPPIAAAGTLTTVPRSQLASAHIEHTVQFHTPAKLYQVMKNG